MFKIGRLCLKIAGRDAGLKCVVIDVIDSNYVLIDGQTRRRKCNIKHLEPLDKVLKVKKGLGHSDVVNELKKQGIEIKEIIKRKKKAAAKPEEKPEIKKEIPKKEEKPKLKKEKPAAKSKKKKVVKKAEVKPKKTVVKKAEVKPKKKAVKKSKAKPKAKKTKVKGKAKTKKK